MASFRSLSKPILGEGEEDDELDFDSLVDAAADNDPVLVSLNFEGWGIGDTGAAELADALRTNTVITLLDLTDNDITDWGLAEIATVLEERGRLCNIRVLYLNNNKIGDHGARSLAKALVKTNINILMLNGNQIGPEGARALSSMLSESTIEEISIPNNRIGNVGCELLTEAVKNNPLISWLDIADNKVGPGWQAKLDAALFRNREKIKEEAAAKAQQAALAARLAQGKLKSGGVAVPQVLPLPQRREAVAAAAGAAKGDGAPAAAMFAASLRRSGGPSSPASNDPEPADVSPSSTLSSSRGGDGAPAAAKFAAALRRPGGGSGAKVGNSGYAASGANGKGGAANSFDDEDDNEDSEETRRGGGGGALSSSKGDGVNAAAKFANALRRPAGGNAAKPGGKAATGGRAGNGAAYAGDSEDDDDDDSEEEEDVRRGGGGALSSSKGDGANAAAKFANALRRPAGGNAAKPGGNAASGGEAGNGAVSADGKDDEGEAVANGGAKRDGNALFAAALRLRQPSSGKLTDSPARPAAGGRTPPAAGASSASSAASGGGAKRDAGPSGGAAKVGVAAMRRPRSGSTGRRTSEGDDESAAAQESRVTVERSKNKLKAATAMLMVSRLTASSPASSAPAKGRPGLASTPASIFGRGSKAKPASASGLAAKKTGGDWDNDDDDDDDDDDDISVVPAKPRSMPGSPAVQPRTEFNRPLSAGAAAGGSGGSSFAEAEKAAKELGLVLRTVADELRSGRLDAAEFDTRYLALLSTRTRTLRQHLASYTASGGRSGADDKAEVRRRFMDEMDDLVSRLRMATRRALERPEHAAEWRKTASDAVTRLSESVDEAPSLLLPAGRSLNRSDTAGYGSSLGGGGVLGGVVGASEYPSSRSLTRSDASGQGSVLGGVGGASEYGSSDLLAWEQNATDADMQRLITEALKSSEFGGVRSEYAAMPALVANTASVAAMSRQEKAQLIEELNRKNPKVIRQIRAEFHRDNSDKKIDTNRLKKAFGW